MLCLPVQYPVDVIKTRIQVFPDRYTSMKQCFRLSLQQVSLIFFPDMSRKILRLSYIPTLALITMTITRPHALLNTQMQEGLAALTRGLTPAVVRAFPVNAVTFSVVSYTLLTWEKMLQYK